MPSPLIFNHRGQVVHTRQLLGHGDDRDPPRDSFGMKQMMRQSPGMETGFAGLPWGCKINEEIRAHYTLMLLLMCLQRQKRIRQQLL